MMEFTFFSADERFTRADATTARWSQDERRIIADFPLDESKLIKTGQRLAIHNPLSDGELILFEVRTAARYEPDARQHIECEEICLAELSDEHIDRKEITDKTAAQAAASVLSGTQWSVGDAPATVSSVDISRGSVWQAMNSICQNWNLFMVASYTVSDADQITGRRINLYERKPDAAFGTKTRLSIRKNLVDACITYDDTNVLTAMYGYGGLVDVPQQGQQDTQQELTFANVTWTETADHPAKPAGQTYIEWPIKTAAYGRNGRPRFGYYQNSTIKDASVLLQKTWETLKESSEPKISMTGTYADLRRLGYTFEDPIRLHGYVIFEIADTGDRYHKEVIRHDYDLLQPLNSFVEIGDYVKNIIYINRETRTQSAGRGGGGGRGMTNLEFEEYDTFAEFEKTHDMIGMVVGTRNGGYYVKAGEIALAINETGEPGSYESTAYITADHVNISATSTAHTLAGAMHIDDTGKLILDNAGGVYVERTNGGVTAQFGVWDQGNLTGGVMAQRINGQSTVKIVADVIDIQGLLTVFEQEAVHLQVGSLYVSNYATFMNVTLLRDEVRIPDQLMIGTNWTAWKTQRVVTAVDVSKSTTHRWLYLDNLGQQQTNNTTMVTNVTMATTTINYLGVAS